MLKFSYSSKLAHGLVGHLEHQSPSVITLWALLFTVLCGFIDYMTGLYNSRAFYDQVATEASRSKRYNLPFTLAYIDLDNFKFINDTKGHSEGDFVLQTVANVLKKKTRKSDFVGRLGGDEFAILLPETDYNGGIGAVKNLLPSLLTSMQDHQWDITFSLGVITFRHPMDTVTEMIKAADELMYTVKKSGKNDSRHRTAD